MSDENNWNQPASPPPPLFVGKKEKDLVKQVNDEIIERVVGQTILYFPISLEHTNFHDLYGEAINKNFLNPVRVYAMVKYQSQTTTTTPFGVDRVEKISVGFHRIPYLIVVNASVDDSGAISKRRASPFKQCRNHSRRRSPRRDMECYRILQDFIETP